MLIEAYVGEYVRLSGKSKPKFAGLTPTDSVQLTITKVVAPGETASTPATFDPTLTPGTGQAPATWHLDWTPPAVGLWKVVAVYRVGNTPVKPVTLTVRARAV